MKQKLTKNDIEIFYAICALLRTNKKVTRANIAKKTGLTWRTVHNRINHHSEYKELR